MSGFDRSDLPNGLSILRLILAPVLLGLALAGLAHAFLVTLIVAFATDAADGYLARRLGTVSERGAKLDSRADLATWCVLAPSFWLLRPDFVEAEIAWIGLAAAGLVAGGVVAFIRFGRMPSYHTYGAKLAAIVLAGALVAVLLGAPAWPLQFATVVAFLSQLEEVAITAILPAPRTDVPSVWHAARLR